MTVDASQAPERNDALAAAVQLGWRVAELYAQVNDPGEPLNHTLLPAHESLEPEDQLELQLRAAEGDARRAGIGSEAGALTRLLDHARRAPASKEAAEAFQAEIRTCHIALEKELWALDEAAGEAYELGNGMSDTYNRIYRAYRSSDVASEWSSVFHQDRIERLKKLLDDLESRRSSAGVAVVKDHLDAWGERVREHIDAAGGAQHLRVPDREDARTGLRRQTVIWRQLITGDKEPEAYLDSDARADLRGRLRTLAWRRCRRWLPAVTLVVFAAVAFGPQVLSWYEKSIVGTGIASLLLAAAGALGITGASALAAVRTRAAQWSQLLWNRAVADEVREKTLQIDTVLPPICPKRRPLAGLNRLYERIRESVIRGLAPRQPRAGV
jgi:hypothetical protein